MKKNPRQFFKKYSRQKTYLKDILKQEGLVLGKRNSFLEEEDLLQILMNSYRPILEEEIENYLKKFYSPSK